MEMAEKRRIRFILNGEKQDILVYPNKTLLEVLRDELGFTGTKAGCEEGECGACSVILNGKVVNSCLVLAVEADGSEIVTIEGLHEGEKLHPIQEAFVATGAVQCGFCTPGMIITTKAMLDELDSPSEREIRHYLAGNLCRCTGYKKIIEAVKDAVKSYKLSKPKE